MSQLDRATRAQVVAINAQFSYMGYRRADRPERLAACAELLGLDELASTSDLTRGQAGKLVRLLGELRARGEQPAAVGTSSAVFCEPAGTHSEELTAIAVAFVLGWCLGLHLRQLAGRLLGTARMTFA